MMKNYIITITIKNIPYKIMINIPRLLARAQKGFIGIIPDPPPAFN